MTVTLFLDRSIRRTGGWPWPSDSVGLTRSTTLTCSSNKESVEHGAVSWSVWALLNGDLKRILLPKVSKVSWTQSSKSCYKNTEEGKTFLKCSETHWEKNYIIYYVCGVSRFLRVHKWFQRTSDLLLRNWLGINVTSTFETKHQQQREFHEKRMSSERGRLKISWIQRVSHVIVFAPWNLRTCTRILTWCMITMFRLFVEKAAGMLSLAAF